MTRYLDPASLSPASDLDTALAYARACGAQWDAVLQLPSVGGGGIVEGGGMSQLQGSSLKDVACVASTLRAGDVIIGGPWQSLAWLPPTIGVEIVPDDTPPTHREDAL